MWRDRGMFVEGHITPEIPLAMTVAEFLEWCPDEGPPWQLVDGVPRVMPPTRLGHGAMLAEAGTLLGNHLLAQGIGGAVLMRPGVIPRLLSDLNFRIPALAVTFSPFAATDWAVPNPVLVIEILSPSNQADTWRNVWAYTTIPSVREILVLRTVTMRADLLRRGADGEWPEAPEVVTEGDLALDSIGFRAPLAALYRTAGLPANG